MKKQRDMASALMQVEPRGLDEQIALANRVQASKVKSLMKSIDKLQKENLSLQKKKMESNRTAQYKRIQDELGQQDVMIDTLQECIGTEKAQQLMTDAIEVLDSKRNACSSCGCEEELYTGGEGSWLCKRCYSQQFWKEPPSDAEKLQVSTCPKFPDSKEQLQKECAALEAELASTKRYLKQDPPVTELPKSAALNTVAALSNILAGYVQRADQLEKENASLKNHQDQLETTVKEQEEQHRQQIQDQIPTFPPEHAKSTVEDLQSRIRLRTGELDRMGQVLDELRSEITAQKSKQEALKTESDTAKNDVRKLQQEMSDWASAETAEHAKQIDKLKQTKDEKKQHLVNSREQLQNVRTKLRKSLINIGDQRGPLEVKARIKGQARKLNSTLNDVLTKRSAWSNFLSQLEVEKGLGLEDPIQELLQRYEDIQSSERPTNKRLQELKGDLYCLEVHGVKGSQASDAARGRWNSAKVEEFRSELDLKLAWLSKAETRLQCEQQALNHLVAEVRKNGEQVGQKRKAELQAALENCLLSSLTTAELHEVQRQHAADLNEIKLVTGPLEESLEELRMKVKDLSKKAADSDQYRQVSQMSVEVEKLRKSVEQERRRARHDVVKLHAAAEHCQEMMANQEGEQDAPWPAELPVPGRLLLVAPGSSAEEAREAALEEARRQSVWEKRFLPVEERDLPAIHLSPTGDTGDLPDDWQESMKLQAQLDLLREELFAIRGTKTDLHGKIEAPDEVRDMEDYVDKLDAVRTDLHEVVADLNMRLQAARVLLQRQMQRKESKAAFTFCRHCPHCHASHGRTAVE